MTNAYRMTAGSSGNTIQTAIALNERAIDLPTQGIVVPLQCTMNDIC